MSESREPNFLYIGTSKAGSTWIFKVLQWHPEIYMYPGKDLGFFTSEYDRGWDWYTGQFTPQPQHKIVGEVAHSYLISSDARDRIHLHMPDAKLMVCLREPVERTFSQYLDGIKNGKISGTLEDELENTESLINRSRYGTHLAMYLERFPRDQILIASFDELRSAPERFAERMFDFLGVAPIQLPDNLRGKILPAGTPRVRSVAMAAKKVARLADQIGLSAIKGRAKTSPFVRNLLYRPFKDENKPTMPSDIENELKTKMADEIHRLDDAAGTDFAQRWGYAKIQ